MSRPVEPVSQNKWGDDVHPAFGAIGATRVSSSPPGAVLFDSDVRHGHSVVITISRNTRKRDLNRDWLHPAQELIEVELSEAQWASFVSSMNVSNGVPCTLRRVAGEQQPGLPYEPRLRESMAEVHASAEAAFADIREALDAYEALDAKAGVKARRDALRELRAKVQNATPNVDYAAKSLGEHAENVVQRARADVEAMVVSKAQQLGLDPATVASPLALTEGGDL